MIKIKKTGFTLSEMLIALSVVGVLAILVLPGVIKDSIGKANMALLQSSVGIMNDTVQNEMVKMGGSSNYANSKIATDPEGFLKNIDIAKSKGAGDLIFKPAGGYKNLDGGALSSVATTFAASAVLKNGAGVGLAAYDADAGYQVVAIDVNGSKGPNIVGVDYFELKIIGVNDFDTGEHIGDVGAFQTENSLSDVQSSCKNGVAADCYYLVEHSGFDSDYVNKDYTVKKSD